MNILLADESVDYRIVLPLRKRGFFIESIQELNPGISDDDILVLCNESQYILITEDKDFGDLTIRLKKQIPGIVLLRLSGLSIDIKCEIAIESFVKNFNEFCNAFSVLSLNKLRIRRLNNPDSL